VGIELRGGVVLREFMPEDRADFLGLVHDEKMFEFMKFRLEEETAGQHFDDLVAQADSSPRHIWYLVIESPEGEFTGWAGLGCREDGAELGWYLTSRHWGRGYATEATRLLVDFAFNIVGLRRLYATADPENRASCRVLEKSGLVLRGPTDTVTTWRGVRPRVMYEVMNAKS
jgi:[ribosomal protein S5]-alanine N-acetyltransferase